MSLDEAALKAANQKMHHDWMAEHAELEHLKDEMAKYTGPLTDEQARMVGTMRGGDGSSFEVYQCVDAAIRAAREGAGA